MPCAHLEMNIPFFVRCVHHAMNVLLIQIYGISRCSNIKAGTYMQYQISFVRVNINMQWMHAADKALPRSASQIISSSASMISTSTLLLAAFLEISGTSLSPKREVVRRCVAAARERSATTGCSHAAPTHRHTTFLQLHAAFVTS